MVERRCFGKQGKVAAFEVRLGILVELWSSFPCSLEILNQFPDKTSGAISNTGELLSAVITIASSLGQFPAPSGSFQACLQRLTTLQQRRIWAGTWRASCAGGLQAGELQQCTLEVTDAGTSGTWTCATGATNPRRILIEKNTTNSLYSKGTAADLYTLGVHFISNGRWFSCMTPIVVNGSCTAKW